MKKQFKTAVPLFAIVLAITFFIASGTKNIWAQPAGNSLNPYFVKLSGNLPNPKGVSRYHINCDYFNHTLLNAKMIDKLRVSGDLTISNGETKTWNNVRFMKSTPPDGKFTEGELQSYMENFSYNNKAGLEMMKTEFFKGFPNEAVQVKNLVWDMAALDAFGFEFLDSLKLNTIFEAKTMNGPAEMGGVGTFTNKNIQLIWKGLSMVDGELCAIIDYRAMDNPLVIDLKLNNMQCKMNGRSHYWGTIWVSLKEKSIAYAELLEDVAFRMEMGAQMPPQDLYISRYMEVKKMK